MAKQLKKFCRITKYIEKTAPKLYEILDDLCVMGAFRPRRGHTGTTFIWPSKETIAKLDKLRYSEDIDKGCDIVLAHIIHDYMPNAAAWNNKKSDIPNGSNRKVEVKSVTGNKVTLVDGAEIEHDAKFKTFRAENQTQAVWRVVKGSIDCTKYTKPASFQYAREGAPQPREQGEVKRRSWHGKVGGNLVTALGGGGLADAPFGKIVAFYEHLKKGDNKKLFNELRLVISPEMITTCAFLTRRCAGEPCALSAALDEFLSNHKSAGIDKSEMHYMQIVDDAWQAMQKARGGGSGIQKLEGALSKAIDDCRNDSEDAINRIALPDDFTADIFTLLNLSRAMENDILGKINPGQHVDEMRDDIKDLIEIINSRIEGRPCAETCTKNHPMLISSLLQAVKSFHGGPFATYPMSMSKVLLAKNKKRCLSLYTDKGSLANSLSRLTTDQLSELFSSLTPKDSEERDEKRDENGDKEDDE